MRRLLIASVLLLSSAPTLQAEAVCTCAAARVANGWCEAHAVGYVAGVAIRSNFLFEALDAHGHDVDPTTFTCPECKRAIETDGFCAAHRIGFLRGQAYFSKLTHLLARGDIRRTSELQCPVCRKNSEGHGWCDKCRVGMAGAFALDSRQEFEEVTRELQRLEAVSRVAERCEYCAVAAWTDTQCPSCRISYRDGRALAPE